jgi:hypothetical protein
MRRSAVAVAICGSLAVVVAAAVAQQITPLVVEVTNQPEKTTAKAVTPLQVQPIVTAQTELPRGPVNFYVGQVAHQDGMVVDSYIRLADVTQAVNEQVEKWKQAENKSDRDKIQQSLHDTLKDQFKARLDNHEKEIDRLESEVKRLREQLELRRKKQDEIIDFRMQQILRDAQGLGWGTEPVPQMRPNPNDANDYRIHTSTVAPVPMSVRTIHENGPVPGRAPLPSQRLKTQPPGYDRGPGGTDDSPKP